MFELAEMVSSTGYEWTAEYPLAVYQPTPPNPSRPEVKYLVALAIGSIDYWQRFCHLKLVITPDVSITPPQDECSSQQSPFLEHPVAQQHPVGLPHGDCEGACCSAFANYANIWVSVVFTVLHPVTDFFKMNQTKWKLA
jgi:hypothetical protein